MVSLETSADVYILKENASPSNRDVLRIILILNSNRPIVPNGIEVPKEFGAIAGYQYQQLPEDLKEFFEKTTVSFKRSITD
jgi:hypothetical protein